MNIYLIGHNYRQRCQQIANLFDGALSCIATTTDFEISDNDCIVVQLDSAARRIRVKCVVKGVISWRDAAAVQNLSDIANLKRAIVRALFDCLAALYQERPAWGILVGVRPTKLVNSLFDKGYSSRQIATILAEQYYLSDAKIELLLEVCRAAKPHLKSLDDAAFSIYIGIPFCPTRCHYCSFTAQPATRGSRQIGDYVAALIEELKAVSSACRGRHIDALYIGGGTPALLTSAQIDQIFAVLRECYQCDQIREITFEAGRPELIDAALLDALQRNGVDRICINPQTMHDVTLQKIGRRHTAADVLRAFQLAGRYSFKALNVDLIAGLDGEDGAMFAASLRRVLDYQPANVTVHTLALKRTAALTQSTGKRHRVAPQIARRQLQIADQLLRTANYRPYYLYRQKQMLANLENIGYCQAGKASIYNIVIIEERQTILAFGAATSSKIVFADGTLEQLHNPKDVALYLKKWADCAAQKYALLLAMGGAT